MNNKILVIINGVTGAIGASCLAQFSRKDNVIIYGLSRKGTPISDYLDSQKKLPISHLICSIGKEISNINNCEEFAKSINVDKYQKIIYIHAVGFYPFEIDYSGKIKIENDHDKDGINDKVLDLSYYAFFNMIRSLEKYNKPVSAVIFGGIADKYKPSVHYSWWTVIEKIKNEIKNSYNKNTFFNILNISSVICPHEMLTRPFIFQNTDANPKFWVTPEEVAKKVLELTTLELNKRFIEEDFFHKSDYYHKNYYEDKLFTERKVKELGLNNIKTT